MTIELIPKRVYNKLYKIQTKHPILTFDNIGYQYIDKSKFSAEDIKAFEEVTTILSKAIRGFVEFNNFKVRETGEICVRFQYDWTADDPNSRISFTGVGYLELKELHKGFKNGN